MRCDDGVNVSVLFAHVLVQCMYSHCTKPTDEKGSNGPFETRIGNRVILCVCAIQQPTTVHVTTVRETKKHNGK